MSYITSKEASHKWGISLRQVQRLLVADCVLGAEKHGRSWMIPADAPKPNRLQNNQTCAEELSVEELLSYLSSALIAMPKDNPDAAINMVHQEREKLFTRSCLSYFRGDFTEVISCFRKGEKDLPAMLSIAQPVIGAAISVGDFALFAEIEDLVQKVINKSVDELVTGYAELALFGGYLGAEAPDLVSGWLKDGNFPAFPLQAKLVAVRLRAKYFQCIGDYEAMLSAAQTALSFGPPKHEITVPSVYLLLYCAIACHMLDQKEQAEQYLLDTMSLCLAHGFITPIAEYVLAFNGLVEKLMERHFPEWSAPVLSQAHRTLINWISFHNQFTKNKITQLLSLREYEIALLASRGVPYAKIAQQHSISVSRLKTIMGDIYGKLLISSRKDLATYVL